MAGRRVWSGLQAITTSRSQRRCTVPAGTSGNILVQGRRGRYLPLPSPPTCTFRGAGPSTFPGASPNPSPSFAQAGPYGGRRGLRRAQAAPRSEPTTPGARPDFCLICQGLSSFILYYPDLITRPGPVRPPRGAKDGVPGLERADGRHRLPRQRVRHSRAAQRYGPRGPGLWGLRWGGMLTGAAKRPVRQHSFVFDLLGGAQDS